MWRAEYLCSRRLQVPETSADTSPSILTVRGSNLSRALRLILCLAAVLGLASPVAFGQYAANRYALILEDPPVMAQYPSRGLARTSAASDYRQIIADRHRV